MLYHSDGTTALDTTIAFPSTADSVTVSLVVPLLTDAPASSEPMTVDLGYLVTAGDTVFKGGPIYFGRAPAHQAAEKIRQYRSQWHTGAGGATSVAITPPYNSTAAAGAFHSLLSRRTRAAVLVGTPIVWTSLDTTIAKITAPAANVGGVAQTLRGTAQIVATLLTGAADLAQLLDLRFPRVADREARHRQRRRAATASAPRVRSRSSRRSRRATVSAWPARS